MTTPSFLGIPVEGDINFAHARTPQRPIEDLAPLIQALLDDDTIVEFGWRQYTPYFDDGDPCEFSAYGTWVRTDQDLGVYDDRTGELDVDYHRTLGRPDYAYDHEKREWVRGPYEGPDEARYERCKQLSKAIESGEFLDVLLSAFGDHAKVTVRRDGIQVDFYEHD